MLETCVDESEATVVCGTVDDVSAVPGVLISLDTGLASLVVQEVTASMVVGAKVVAAPSVVGAIVVTAPSVV